MNDFKCDPHPSLETERLLLRPIRMEDAPELFEMRSNKENRRFINAPLSKNQEEVVTFIEKISKGIVNHQWLFWGIQLLDAESIIGSICIWNLSADRFTADVGYELSPEGQGKGYMQEALNAVVDFSFQRLEIKELLAFTHSENYNSRRLLDQCNFVLKESFEELHHETGAPFQATQYYRLSHL